MVRVGVVNHPSEWPFSGYNEILTPPRKYSLIDWRRLLALLGLDDSDRFSKVYQGWVEDILRTSGHNREAKWTQSIAVGRKSFVEDIKDKLGFGAIGRRVVGTKDGYELKEKLG
jgi:putative transposase